MLLENKYFFQYSSNPLSRPLYYAYPTEVSVTSVLQFADCAFAEISTLDHFPIVFNTKARRYLHDCLMVVTAALLHCSFWLV